MTRTPVWRMSWSRCPGVDGRRGSSVLLKYGFFRGQVLLLYLKKRMMETKGYEREREEDQKSQRE